MGSFDLPSWFKAIIDGGLHGVTLFFVVSAFTLTRQFARRGLTDLPGYALRRIFRLGPAFWVAALAYAIITGFSATPGSSGFGITDYVYGLTFAGWLGSPDAIWVVPGGWSVQTEFVFYISLPIIVWLARGHAWRAATMLVIAMVIAQVASRNAMLVGTWIDMYMTPLIQLPVFLTGVTVALLPAPNIFSPGFHHIGRLLSIGLLFTAVVGIPFSPLANWYFATHIQFSLLVGLAAFFAAWQPPDILKSKFLVAIGTVSYSMYLIHFALLWPMYHTVSWFLPGNGTSAFVVYFATTTALSFGMSLVSYRWIEQPPRRWIAARLRARQHSLQQPVTP